MKGLIGTKVGMTQIFDESGAVVPVTLIEAGPCYVTQVKQVAKEGYSAVQLGFGEVNSRRLTGGQLGHLKRHDVAPLRVLREFRVKDVGPVKPGDRISVDVFAVGDHVDVVGTSKGKGFQGGMRRHHFRGGPRTHGQSDRQRAPGSHGATTTPGRVFKGSRAAGHMGSARVTGQNLRVEVVDPARNLIGVRGSVPGARGALVVIQEGRKQ
jgi:large subunit ribosomal protein L3